jgi:soluble lytic murein transglycosylase-like protein/predicted negative regulator of RcsB-dependent stress response
MTTWSAAARRVGTAAIAVLLVACGRSAPAPTPAATAPAAAPAPEPAVSIDDVRALRTAGQNEDYEKALKVLALSTDQKTRGRAEALLGLFYFERDEHDAAVPWLQKAAEDDPLVAPWLWLRIGDLVHVNRVIQFGSDTTAGAIARLRVAGLYATAGDVNNTNAAVAYAKSIPLDEITDEEFVQMARALSKAGRDDLAAGVRMRLLGEYPQGRFTEENYGALTKLTPSPLDSLSREATLDLAKKLGNTEHFDEALDLLRRFAERTPSEAAVVEYRNLRMRSLFQSRHYEELLAQYDEASLKGDAAMLLLRARAAWRSDKPEEFLASLNRIEQVFPKSAEANDVKILRAKYYMVDEPKLDVAIDNLQQVIASGTYGNDGEHLWTLGWAHYLAKHDDDALRVFAGYRTKFPDGDYLSNSLFWSGKIHERLGRTAERDAAWDALQATYPYNYFSYRARELRGQPAVAPSEIANGNAFPDLDADLAAMKTLERSRLDLIAELTWLGLYREAIPNVKMLADAWRENAAAAFMLADTFVQAGEPMRANGLLQRRFRNFIRHGGTGIPHRLWEILYPLAYWNVIQREASKQSVDPYLLASIARQESIFEPSTVSNAGAVGIMQIMPQEATRIAEASGLQAPTRDQLFDPEVNIAIGAAEYAQKRTAMNGNDTLAIAAYNAGTDAVGKWIAATSPDDGDLFVESIPYSETRLYVKTVTRNRFEYRRIYENGASYSQLSK